MSTTWMVDLRHFLTPEGAFVPDLPGPARRLAEYCASLIVDATHDPDAPPAVRCRRRPRHRRCTGIVVALPGIDEHDPVYWNCPVCNDTGYISGWQDTLWNGFRATASA